MDGAKVILNFAHIGGGLVAKDGALKGFTIAGADKTFRPRSGNSRRHHRRERGGRVATCFRPLRLGERARGKPV